MAIIALVMTLTRLKKNAPENVVCIRHLLHIFTNIIDECKLEANGVDPDETAPVGAVLSGFTLFDQEASKTFQQTTKADNLCCDWCFHLPKGKCSI